MEALGGFRLDRVVDLVPTALRAHPARLTEHLQVVRNRRLAHIATVEVARCDRSVALQPAEDSEAARVSNRAQQAGVGMVRGRVPWTTAGQGLSRWSARRGWHSRRPALR